MARIPWSSFTRWSEFCACNPQCICSSSFSLDTLYPCNNVANILGCCLIALSLRHRQKCPAKTWIVNLTRPIIQYLHDTFLEQSTNFGRYILCIYLYNELKNIAEQFRECLSNVERDVLLK